MSDEQKFRTMDFIIGIAITVSLGVSSWALISLVNLKERVSVIEDSRYSDADAAEDKGAIIQIIRDEFKPVQQKLQEISVNQAVIQRDVAELKAQP